jgi:hypothetical protein
MPSKKRSAKCSVQEFLVQNHKFATCSADHFQTDQIHHKPLGLFFHNTRGQMGIHSASGSIGSHLGKRESSFGSGFLQQVFDNSPKGVDQPTPCDKPRHEGEATLARPPEQQKNAPARSI